MSEISRPGSSNWSLYQPPQWNSSIGNNHFKQAGQNMDRDKQRLLHVIIVVPRKKHTPKIWNHLNVKQISTIFTFSNIYKTVHKIVDWIKIFHFKPRISFLDTQYNINGVIWINCNVIAVQEVNFTLNLCSIMFFGSFKTFNKSIRTQLENLRDIGVLPTLQYIDLWYFLLVVWNLNFVITKPTATHTPLTRILLLYIPIQFWTVAI